jgi:hypothetical protein
MSEPIIKFNLQIRISKRLIIMTNRTIVAICCDESYLKLLNCLSLDFPFNIFRPQLIADNRNPGKQICGYWGMMVSSSVTFWM